MHRCREGNPMRCDPQYTDTRERKRTKTSYKNSKGLTEWQAGSRMGHHKCSYFIRESVDSLCRDGADAQYMQYLRKSRIISPQIH